MVIFLLCFVNCCLFFHDNCKLKNVVILGSANGKIKAL